MANGDNTGDRWAVSGVRELLRPDRARLYAEGVYTWGRSKRSRKKGDTVRLQRAADDANVITAQNDDWRIVGADVARRALAKIEDYNARVLRNHGKLASRPELRGQHLLSGLLRCECGATMVAGVRGKNNRRVYACAAYRERRGTCTNAGAVRMDRLHEVVIEAMKKTFSVEVVESYLQERAADTAQVERARAERARLVDEELPPIAKGIERLTKRLATVDDDVAEVIRGELKSLVTERKAAEARLLALASEGRALTDQAAEVERLREAWQNWAGALEEGGEVLQVRARALIKKALITPLYLRRGEDGCWLFAGLSTYDRGLAGGLGSDGFVTVEYPDSTDRDRLFLKLVNALGVDTSSPAGLPRRFRVVTFDAPEPRPIAGGSDAMVRDGHSSDMAPHTPHAPRRGGAVALRGNA